MKSFLLSSILILCLSCATRQAVLLPATTIQTVPQESVHFPFNNGAGSFFFKMGAHIYGHYLSGLLLIKPVGIQNSRIVLTTEMGIKLFDLELTEKKLLVHYCIPKLRRKAVLQLLEKDFRLLLTDRLTGSEAWNEITAQEKKYIIREGKDYNVYYTAAASPALTRIENISSKGKKKVIVTFDNYKNNFPGTINIAHQNIQLTITLNFIER
jgi:hypothetical protein